MLKNIFDILFVLSLITPIVALVGGAFALAFPTMRLRSRTPTTRRMRAHVWSMQGTTASGEAGVRRGLRERVVRREL